MTAITPAPNMPTPPKQPAKRSQGPKASTFHPAPADVVEAREEVRGALRAGGLGAGITAGQDWCALALHTSRRTWQQWEAGKAGGGRDMSAADWELLNIKLHRVRSGIDPIAALKPAVAELAPS